MLFRKISLNKIKWIYIVSFIVIIVAIFVLPTSKNNVCKTFKDYYTNRDNNKNCYYNPDYALTVGTLNGQRYVDMITPIVNVFMENIELINYNGVYFQQDGALAHNGLQPEIIRRHNYPSETHQVTTKDGYILTMFRIPHGKRSKVIGEPVFIQHGITINSGAFVNIGNKSLGFVLADAGYDVWLGNFRGSMYSRQHNNFSEWNPEFWEYSFHELGVYDLPSQLDFVANLTKKKITYIGFSMGSTAGYIYGITYPDEAYKKIKSLISIAPVAFMDNLPLYYVLSWFWTILEKPLHLITKGKILPRPLLPSFLFKLLCLPFPIQMEVCQIPDMVAFGLDYDQNDPETLPITLQHNKDATSIKTITHYAQVIRTGNFQYYDYGPRENIKIYGSDTAPRYDLNKMKVPNYLLSAPNDQLATKANAEKLFRALPERAKSHDVYVINHDSFNHVSFFTGKDALSLVYKPIIDFIDKYK